MDDRNPRSNTSHSPHAHGRGTQLPSPVPNRTDTVESMLMSAQYIYRHRASAGGGDPKGPSPSREDSSQQETATLTKPKVSVPRRYKVIFHNDDFTTMEFVVEVLQRFFRKSESESVHIMLTVHKKGKAIAGVYTRDVAETKVAEVTAHARERGMPLMLTTEPE